MSKISQSSHNHVATETCDSFNSYPMRVMVTGATGFVGRRVIKTLLHHAIHPVCLVRSVNKLRAQLTHIDQSRYSTIEGSLYDIDSLREAAKQSVAAIHLVGIIIERRLRKQRFDQLHVEGTKHVIDALQNEGITRYIHMSALGTRANAVSKYHQTKWQAEELVRQSGLVWTILRPSLIHGPNGEFMQLMNRFICSPWPPCIPYFGNGSAKLQPIYVKDIAQCIVECLARPKTIEKVYDLGGPSVYTWRSFYHTCRLHMPNAKLWKPLVSLPVPLANLLATLNAPIMALAESFVPGVGLFRFDRGQVHMSQEDSVCDHTIVEKACNMKFRSFEEELALYANLIS